ncbi:MAG: nucleotide exchange factor GrpE [Magnetococcales bacterium]|nr:nucleotide exchange factor GrpE [Magnetococcales bacterium]MBF0157698.1 nucleotide exchange factor GrpE [Magnetococcales bacterium]
MSDSPSLEEQLAEATRLAGQAQGDYLRVLAEMENLRKRTTREVQQARKFAVEAFAKDLLPVADNMERAMVALEQGSESPLETLVEGVKLTQKTLISALGKHGVVRIQALHEPFDPNWHQAMMQVPDGGAKPGTVVMEMQAGYLLSDRLLRPAMVAVAVESQPDSGGN